MTSIVIIGGGTAGAAAALAARRENRDAAITVLGDESYYPYRRPVLGYVVTGDCSIDDIQFNSAALRSQNITYVKGARVERIDPEGKTVHAGEQQYPYDALILATGSHEQLPDTPGLDAMNNVFTLRTYLDAEKIGKAKNAGSFVVIGAGMVAIIALRSLAKLGVPTTHIVRSEVLRTGIEPELAAYLRTMMEREGIAIKQGVTVEKFSVENGAQRAHLSSGEVVDADAIIIATGFSPTISLATQIGVAQGPSGAIAVDEHMKTNIDSIYACGDCAELRDGVTGKMSYYPLASLAVKGGAIAGKNAAGGTAAQEGYLRTQSETFGPTTIVSVGYTFTQAKKIVDENAARHEFSVSDAALPCYVVTDNSGKIIGASALFRRQASHYTSLLWEGFAKGMTLEELKKLWDEPYRRIYETVRR